MTIKTGHLYTNKSTNSTVETSIDFEKDQQDAMKKTEGIQSLADQVEKLEELNERLEDLEGLIKNTKQDIQKVSGDIIPTMMSEMGLAELKLHDGSHLKVSTSYRATITEANKEAAFNWLRENGLGDIIKNEISVSFGRNEDNKAADYVELAKGQGLEPQQKLKVEPMTCLLYTSPSPRDKRQSRMPSSA